MSRTSDLKPGDEADYSVLAPVPDTSDLRKLRTAAAKCQACPLYRNADQTVFGEGGPDVDVFFIGEQPGDKEDTVGKPFVGPAGGILDQALRTVGIDRSKSYVTNAVKHFKWKPRGKLRIHQKPSSREIEACRPWLSAEIRSLQPGIIVCLGATAVRSAFGKDLPILKKSTPLDDLSFLFENTDYGSPLFRSSCAGSGAKEKAWADFVADLKVVAEAAVASSRVQDTRDF